MVKLYDVVERNIRRQNGNCYGSLSVSVLFPGPPDLLAYAMTVACRNGIGSLGLI